MPLDQNQRKEIEKVFLSFNDDDTGALSFEEFYQFLQEAWENQPKEQPKNSVKLSKSIGKFIFDAIANESSTSVIFPEVLPLIEAVLDRNTDFLIRFVYKAMDKDRTDQISTKIIPKAAQLFGFKNCESVINEKIRRNFGENKQTLTYQEFYQLLTNVPKEQAPLPSARQAPESVPLVSDKSKCCLLL